MQPKYQPTTRITTSAKATQLYRDTTNSRTLFPTLVCPKTERKRSKISSIKTTNNTSKSDSIQYFQTAQPRCHTKNQQRRCKVAVVVEKKQEHICLRLGIKSRKASKSSENTSGKTQTY